MYLWGSSDFTLRVKHTLIYCVAIGVAKEERTYSCISRGRFSWGGRVVAVEWQVQVNSGWFTQGRKGWQAVRHVHVSHREEHIFYTRDRERIKKGSFSLDRCNHDSLYESTVNMIDVSTQPRLDTVLVVWLSKRSGSAPGTVLSFFRQRFSSICNRYSSSCCMGRFFLSLAHSCAPLHKREETFLWLNF